MIVVRSDQRTDPEHSGVACRTGHVHHILFNDGAVVALEDVDGIVVGLEIVGIDDGVATKYDVVVERDIDRLELLVFKSAVLNQDIFIEQGHILALKVKCDAAVHKLATDKLGVVVNNAVTVVHVD